MRKYINKIVIFFICIMSFSTILNAQNNEEIESIELDINNKIDYANWMIRHLNIDIFSLNMYQEELMTWFEQPNRKMEDIPQYYFMNFFGNNLNMSNEFSNSDDIFDYNHHIGLLEKQILLYNIICEKLINLKSPNSEVFREDIYDIILSIHKLSINISDVSNDFTQSCSINLKENKFPDQLQILNEIIYQTKNFILALRHNDKQKAESSIYLLDMNLLTYRSEFNIDKLNRETNAILSFEKLNKDANNIYNKAKKISFLGKKYFRTRLTPEEKNILLQNTISIFNESEGQMGCASSFNSILKKIDANYMLAVEEPNTIFANIIEEEAIDENKVVDNFAKKKVPKLFIKTNKTVPFADAFDMLDNNSLEGSLPNNIIILMDVSASMKKSGKLPILKKSIEHLLGIMRGKDVISLIAYSGEAKVLVSGAKKREAPSILKILENLSSSGGSDLKNALELAYLIAENNYKTKGNNKLIIASDGVFGVTPSILSLVKQKANDNFNLSIFQYNDIEENSISKYIKNLAAVGNGKVISIAKEDDAIKLMMQEIKVK